MADSPVTTCKKSGRKMTAPNSAVPVRKPSAELTAKIEFLKRRIGRIGSRARLSQTTNAASTTHPTAARPTMTGEPHSYSVPPHTNDNSTQPTPTTSKSAPAMSIRCG